MSAEITYAGTEIPTRRGQLWHKAADVEQNRRARAGLSWRTRCGQNVKPPKGSSRKAWNLAPMERCVVCMATPPPDTDPSG